MPRRDPEIPLAALLLGAVLLAGFGYQAVTHYRIGYWPGASPPAALPTFLSGDGPYYRATLSSMTGDFDLDLRNQLASLGYNPAGNVSLGRHGEWYPKHPFLLPLVSAPFFSFGDRGLLAFNVVQLTALMMVSWWFARRYAPDGIAAVVCAVFAFTTLLRPAAYNYSPDVLSALLAAGGLLALVCERPIAAGLLLGLSVWAKLPNLVLLVPAVTFAALAWSRRRVVFLAALAAPIVALGIIQAWMFGSPWVTSYDRVIAGFGAAGPVLEASHRTFYDVPFWSGLRAQMLDARIGLLASAPAIVLVPFGLVALWRRSRRDAILIGAACALQILSFAKYRLWYESTFGHRFLILTVVLAVVPVAALVEACRQYVTARAA